MVAVTASAVNQQRRGIVEQALAFEDDVTRCGMRNGRITAEAATASGGATMAPMAIAAAQGMSGNIAAQGPGHRDDGEADGDEHQRHHRNPHALQIAQRGVEGGVQQRWRHEQRQRQCRIDLNLGRVRYEGQRRATQRQQRRVGQFQIPRQPR